MVVLMAVLFLVNSCSMPTIVGNSVLATGTPVSEITIESPLSATVTPDVTQIPTPNPTLSPSQITEIVRGLYDHNGGCELPCLWGIVPGEASIQDIYDRFSQISYFENQTRTIDHFEVIAFATTISPINPISPYNNNIWGFSMRVDKKLEIIVGLNIGAANIKEFSSPSLSKFFARFGKPEEIRVRVIESMLIGENPDYEIALYYPTKGIFIRWRGEAESVISQTEKNITVTVCPQYMHTKADTQKGSFPPHFYLFSPDKNMPFEEIIERHLSEDPSGSYQPLHQDDVEKFYTMYLDATNQDCFPFSYSLSP